MAITEVMDRLAARPEPVAELIVASLVAEIPAYSALEAPVLDAVREIATLYVTEAAVLMREHRDPTSAEMAGFAESARARARDGVSLEDVLHALRLGFAVLWGEVHARLAADGRDFDAAMEVGTRFMRYFDLAAGVVARHYLDERERLTASADRRHGELIAVLLHEGLEAAAELAALEGVRLAPAYVTLVFAPRRSGPAALVRTLRRLPLGTAVLAAVEGDRVLALWPALPGDTRAALHRACQALTAEHGPMLVTYAGLPFPATPGARILATGGSGASGPRTDGPGTDGPGTDGPGTDGPGTDGPGAGGLGAGSLGAGSLGAGSLGAGSLDAGSLDGLAGEARALQRVLAGRTGLFCLEDVLLDAVIHQAGGRTDTTVRALADPLPADLRTTLAAYVESGLSVRETAQALTVHRNTVLYRLGQIHRLTGRDPRNVTDLFLLHAALALS